jgi:hypothetical protein
MTHSSTPARLGAAFLGAALVLACNSAAQPGSSPQAIPIPAPDRLPTAIRQRQDPEPPLDYILVALEAIVRRLRQLVQVFTAGMVPSGISG